MYIYVIYTLYLIYFRRHSFYSVFPKNSCVPNNLHNKIITAIFSAPFYTSKYVCHQYNMVH